MEQSPRTNSSHPPMPDELACRFLPYTALKLMYGATVEKCYCGREDLVAVWFNSQAEVLHVNDFEVAQRTADVIWNRLVAVTIDYTRYNSMPMMMTLHRAAAEFIAASYGQDKRKRALFLLSDQYGCGFWRMMLPATSVKSPDWMIDISPAEIVYDYLCSYNTVMLQRVCNWNSYYVVKRLQEARVRVVYDLDDNFWELPQFHPAWKKFGPDEKEAAKAIVRQVDAVTVTTQGMAEAVCRHCGDVVRDKLTIIPNAIDSSMFVARPVYPLGSTGPMPFRLLWAGSATHEQDFNVCLEALDKFMANHTDDEDIRVMFMGFLPQCVARLVQQKHWFKKVEHMEFVNIETYFSLLGRVKADLAIAPLLACPFNAAKSNIKWVEYTMAGIPVLASKFGPYAESIIHGETGLLASTTDEWLAALEDKYAHRISPRWQVMMKKARAAVEENYSIAEMGKKWTAVLEGSAP